MSGGLFKHSWTVTPAEAVRLQEQIRKRVIERPLKKPIRLIAGVDAALSAEKDQIVAAVVLLQTDKPWFLNDPAGIGPSLSVLEQQYAWAELNFPYIPGLLSFREAPAVLRALEKLSHEPDLVILDAQGQAHPRRAGLASHVGVISGLPCVGCAKSRLIGHHVAPGLKKGCCVDLLDEKDELIGKVVRTRRAVKPVYVSVGHLVSLDQAVKAVLGTTSCYRLPEPTRLAHLLAAKLKLDWTSGGTAANLSNVGTQYIRWEKTMINCRECEFCKVGPDGRLGFSCDPFGNVKEPECINKWLLLKMNMMVEAYHATLEYYRRLAPLQERMFKHVERELDDMNESDKWKLPEEEDQNGPNEHQ